MSRDKPAPISLKKPSRKKASKPVAPFNMDAPEHREPARIVKKIVKDKALEARVARLEGAEIVQPIVQIELPVRPRIAEIAIKYDPFGQPISLVPTYGE